MSILKVVKKPIPVEALQYTGSNDIDCILWIGRDNCTTVISPFTPHIVKLDKIKTLEGDFKVTPGCYIIKGIHGEFYPCDKNIFEESYRESTESSTVDGDTSDGYHTFNELYRFRLLYNAAMFNLLSACTPLKVTKSKCHHDGEECFGGGWFIVQAQLPNGQISNHYELKDWDLFDIPEVERADKWDGHTPQDVAERLEEFCKKRLHRN